MSRTDSELSSACLVRKPARGQRSRSSNVCRLLEQRGWMTLADSPGFSGGWHASLRGCVSDGHASPRETRPFDLRFTAAFKLMSTFAIAPIETSLGVADIIEVLRLLFAAPPSGACDHGQMQNQLLISRTQLCNKLRPRRCSRLSSFSARPRSCGQSRALQRWLSCSALLFLSGKTRWAPQTPAWSRTSDLRCSSTRTLMA